MIQVLGLSLQKGGRWTAAMVLMMTTTSSFAAKVTCTALTGQWNEALPSW